MSNELLHEFESATSEFLDRLDAFDQQQINAVPYEGSWTAAQVGEHIFKSDNFILQSLNGPTQPTNRPPDAGVADIRKMFLDFGTQLQSPDVIIPAQCTHDKEALISALKMGREQIAHVIRTNDLSATCDNPIFGKATRLEMLTFVIVHTQRHIHQLKKIAANVLHAQPS